MPLADSPSPTSKRGLSAAPTRGGHNKLDQHVVNQKFAGKNSLSTANLHGRDGSRSPKGGGAKNRAQSVDRVSGGGMFGAGASSATNNAHKYGNFPKLTGSSGHAQG